MSGIVIDISRLAVRFGQGRLPTGVDRVSLAYLRHFAPRARALIRKGRRIWVFTDDESQRLFSLLLNPSAETGRRISSLLATHIVTPWRHDPLPRGTILFNTGHSGVDHPDYLAWIAAKGCRPIYMVHDLIPLTHPEFCRPDEDQRHRLRLRAIVQSAAGVVANSGATLAQLGDFAAAEGIPLPPAVAAPLAAWELPPPSPSRPIADPYFVILGTIEPRKNLWLILQLWRRLVEALGDAAPRLVVIGQRGWECENIVDMLERCALLKDHVIELAGPSDTAVATYLRHAEALLFPSFAEGYGLPLAEALALGTPVIASDLEVFKELFGEVPDYIDPLDGMRWIEVIRDYATDGRMKDRQRARMTGLILPTWADHFVKVEGLLERIKGDDAD